MFFGETSPPNVVSALSFIIRQKPNREEAEKKVGRNSIYALAKLGLVSVDGTPSIPPSLRKQPLESVVRLAAKENHVISFVCDLLDEEPNLPGVEIGARVAEEFDCNWVRKSKQRNGAALARWASWVKAGEREGRSLPAFAADVEKLVEHLRTLDESEFGSLVPAGRYSGTSEQLSHGRPAKITKHVAEACKILREKYGMSMVEISARVGVSRPAIYRAFDRYKFTASPSG